MLQEYLSLKKYNSFGIDAVARYFSGFSDLEELQGLLEFEQGTGSQLSTMILGGGSNILFTKNFDGLVLKK